MPDPETRALIEHMALEPHPEGGWYRETWRGAADADGRAGETAIHFLLEDGQASHWHRVDAVEFWLWHAGHPLTLSIAPSDAGPIETIRLGSDVLSGDRPQCIVPAGAWQAAHAEQGWALVSCIVSPGFEFSGFTLAEPGWSPGR